MDPRLKDGTSICLTVLSLELNVYVIPLFVDLVDVKIDRPKVPLHDPVTWYQMTHAGEQVAQWDLQNNAPAFVLIWKCNLYHVTKSVNFELG